MISYYRSLFKKFLKGEELSEELVECVVKHRSGLGTCSDMTFSTYATRGRSLQKPLAR